MAATVKTAEPVSETEPKKEKKKSLLKDDPLWYKDAVIYELHVRSFADSDGDGIGDFRGLTERLDYLSDLGITAIWLLPFYPSPLRDDGYDIADYTNVHPSYGTLSDFRLFLKEAHQRHIRVITELVLNHTSDQHPWFQKARTEKPGSPYRNFYVWSDTPEKYKEARIIFKDFEHSNWTWDPVAKAYYWHRFYSHQPDLNFDNPHVRKSVKRVLDFWLEMGVDGLRLDAIPYLYERDQTNCENLPETHAFLRELHQHVNQKYRSKVLLAEANQWPEDAYTYFGKGDECHMAFHFPLMPRLFMASRMESSYPIIEIFQQTPEIPESCQWAIFLRNHDELTLEMVTDEERDYMYRVYGQDHQMRVNLGIRRRLMPLLENNRRKYELLNGLLLSMPGTPVLYYGDELGMGDNIYLGDRNGVRTPMQWSADRNAGFSRANPQQLYLPIIIDPEYHYEAINVETRQRNLSSLLWWMRRMIAIRSRHKAFGRGRLAFLDPKNSKVLAFVRSYQDERILVVANLSRFVQYVELDLSAFKETVPVELFGQTEFPEIGEGPYVITLGPHSFYWFVLKKKEIPVKDAATEPAIPTIEILDEWDSVFKDTTKKVLEEILPGYLKTCRWFGGKARTIRSVEIFETIPILKTAYMILLELKYREGETDVYLLPLSFATGAEMNSLMQTSPKAAVAFLDLPGGDGVLYDGVYDKAFCKTLLLAMARRRQFKGSTGRVMAEPTRVFRKVQGATDGELDPHLLGAEQSNTSVLYGDRTIMKLFRRLQPGMNPDVEIGKFLTEKTSFAHMPPAAGFLEYRRDRRGEPIMLAFLQGFVSNQGDAWRYTLEMLGDYFEQVLAKEKAEEEFASLKKPLLAVADMEPSPFAVKTIGAYLESAKLLGIRTGELHVALASERTDPAFSPEPFSTLYQRSLYQSMRSLTTQAFQLLRRHLSELPEEIRKEGEKVLSLEKELLKRLQLIIGQKISAVRTRCHGDYHLGQVLFTGKDFVIIDFEGEPARSLSERRLKSSPLRDVAGMIRSFHYAASIALFGQEGGEKGQGAMRREDIPTLAPWTQYWYVQVSAAFLRAYFETTKGTQILPRGKEVLKILMEAYLLEKAAYELAYELNNRPNWVRIPLQGIAQLIGPET